MVEYYKEHGNLQVPKDYLDSNGKNLNRWLLGQRAYYRKSKLDKDEIDMLEKIGMVWDLKK